MECNLTSCHTFPLTLSNLSVVPICDLDLQHTKQGYKIPTAWDTTQRWAQSPDKQAGT